MITFVVRIYVLFIASFFVAYSNSTAPLHTATSQSNHLSANPANDVVQTDGTMATLSYPGLPENTGIIGTKLPFQAGVLGRSVLINRDNPKDLLNPFDIGSGSILTFKLNPLDPFEVDVVEIKIISAAHVYLPMYRGGLSDKEYLQYLHEHSYRVLTNALLSNRLLVSGDSEGVISPSKIINPDRSATEYNGWALENADITDIKIGRGSKVTRDIIVATYSNKIGLNKKLLNPEESKKILLYPYKINWIETSSDKELCKGKCAIFLNGFGVGGDYKTPEQYEVTQSTTFGLIAPSYSYTIKEDLIAIDVNNLMVQFFDPYTKESIGEQRDYAGYFGYSGATVLHNNGKSKEIIGIQSSVNQGYIKFKELYLTPLTTSDPIYYKWLMDHVGSV